MNNIIYDTCFLSALLLAFSIQQPATIVATYVLCAVYIMMAYDQFTFSKDQIFIYAGITIPCLLAVLNYNHGLTSAFYLLALPLVIVAAKIFANKAHEHIILCLSNVYWLFVVALAVGLAMHWDDPEPLGAIFPGSSTNGLPSYLIVVQIAFSIAYYLKNNRLPLLSAIATLVVAVFGLGRGSMITAALILLFSLFINVSVAGSKTDKNVFLIAAGLMVLPLGFYSYNNYDELVSAVDLLIEGSKFSGGVLDEHRGRILMDYLNKIDVWSLIFGTDYSGTSIVQDYGGNPHNSFIRVHSFYGIAGLLYVALPLFVVAISGRRRVQKNIILILIIFALLRATTDPIFFPSTLDFFYFLYFFIFFNFAERKYCLHGPEVSE